jgi:protein transport protein SEC24
VPAAQVCIDVSILGGGFVDAATVRELPHHTGGQLYAYEGFDARLDATQLLNDLRWNLLRPQVLRCAASHHGLSCPGST